MKKLLLKLGKGINIAVGYFILLTPEVLRWAISYVWSVIFFDIIRFRRDVILSNMNSVFPNFTHNQKLKIARRSIQNQIYNLIEFCLFPVKKKNWFQENTIYQGFEHLDQALTEGKGVLLLSLHLGSGDYAVSAMASKKYSVTVISKKFKIQSLNDYWFALRQRFGAQFLDPHGAHSSFDILKVLKKNGSIVFVLDQFMGPPYGLPTTFFGKPTGTAYGLSLFALKTGAPVLPIWTFRNQDRKNVICIGPQIPLIEGADRSATLLATTQKYNSILEDLIRKNPENWLWFHRRFKSFY